MKKTILLLMSLALILSACTQSNEVVSSSSATSAQGTSSSVSSSSDASSIESSEPETIKLPGIKGSHITDLILNLERTGVQIPKPELKASPDIAFSAHHCISSKRVDSTGLTYDYSLSAAKDFSLISGTFTVTTDFLVDEVTFLKAAQGYLGFCATMPCDAVKDNKARIWLEDVLDHITEKESGENIVFGDAKYNLDWVRLDDGQLASILLTIGCVDPETKQPPSPFPSEEPSASEPPKSSSQTNPDVKTFGIKASEFIPALKEDFSKSSLPNAFAQEAIIEKQSDDTLGDYLTYTYPIVPGSICYFFVTEGTDEIFQIGISADSKTLKGEDFAAPSAYMAIFTNFFESDPKTREKVKSELNIAKTDFSQNSMASASGRYVDFNYMVVNKSALLTISPAF